MTATSLCDACWHVVAGRGRADVAGVARIVDAPRPLVEMALELLVACHQIATTGGVNNDKVYMRLD